jgi:hypothetical protein
MEMTMTLLTSISLLLGCIVIGAIFALYHNTKNAIKTIKSKKINYRIKEVKEQDNICWHICESAIDDILIVRDKTTNMYKVIHTYPSKISVNCDNATFKTIEEAVDYCETYLYNIATILLK